jgi:hypothetical protein
MKTTFLITIFFLLNGFSGKQTLQSDLDSKNIKQIQIRYVDFDIETPIRIECSNFNYFNDAIKIKKIKDVKKVSELLNFLKTAVKNKRNNGLDTRFKLRLEYNSGKIEEICGNEAFIEIANEQFLVSKEFSKYLNKLLK